MNDRMRRMGRFVLPLLVMVVMWAALEGAVGRTVSVTTENLALVSASYGLQSERLDEARQEIAFRQLRRVGHDTSGISWVMPALAGLLIAGRFSSREAEWMLTLGRSRTRFFVGTVARYDGLIWIMRGVTLLLYVLRFGLAVTDWQLFGRIWVLHSVAICGWLSVTALLLNLSGMLVFVLKGVPIWEAPPSVLARMLLLRPLMAFTWIMPGMFVAFASQNMIITGVAEIASFYIQAFTGRYLGDSPWVPMWTWTADADQLWFWSEPLTATDLATFLVPCVVIIALWTLASWIVFRCRDLRREH